MDVRRWPLKCDGDSSSFNAYFSTSKEIQTKLLQAASGQDMHVLTHSRSDNVLLAVERRYFWALTGSHTIQHNLWVLEIIVSQELKKK